MPHHRTKENRGLPSGWVKKHGAYYFRPPQNVKHLWDDKSWFRLGSSLTEAYRVWADRMDAPMKTTTVGDLFDRYLLEVVPTKAVRTQTENRRAISHLRLIFGHMRLDDLEPQHVYKYVSSRTAATAARREVEVLSHVFTKAVEWGEIRRHPFIGQVRLPGLAPRDRYIEDWEIEAALSLESKRAAGSVLMIQAYLRLKLLTGLRQGDLLRLRGSDCKEDGIHVMPEKTKKSTGRRLIYPWTDALRNAIEQVKAVRPAESDFLFCNQFGEGYVDETKGTAKGFNKVWQSFMTRLLEETAVTERFTEHDLRAKVGSDAESLERAKQLLAHSDSKLTQRVYRRKPELVMPVM